jgi:hypothetical protein
MCAERRFGRPNTIGQPRRLVSAMQARSSALNSPFLRHSGCVITSPVSPIVAREDSSPNDSALRGEQAYPETPSPPAGRDTKLTARPCGFSS